MKHNSGFSMIEVMVSLVILTVGLLGLAGLHTRGIVSQNEARQRNQALGLAQDMAERIRGNRAKAAFTNEYRVDPSQGDTPLGWGNNSSLPLDCSATTEAARDLCEWHNGLLGSSTGGTTSSLNGARGCIYQLSTSLPKTFAIAVAWGGLSPTVAPAVNCGSGAYGADDSRRRVIVLTVTMPVLED